MQDSILQDVKERYDNTRSKAERTKIVNQLLVEKERRQEVGMSRSLRATFIFSSVLSSFIVLNV